MQNRNLVAGLSVLYCALFIVYSTFYVRTDGPLLGVGDVGYHEFVGYLFAKQVTWWPAPHLKWFTDLVVYPYGVNAGFQSWSLEREYLNVLCHKLLGESNWLQWYLVASALVTGVGTVLLLRTRYSNLRSWLLAYLTTFLSFGVTHRYPAHLNLGAAHWLVLNIIADFLTCQKVFERQRLSLQWLLLRAALLLACLGGDLSYLAGYALISFTLSSGYVVYALYRQANWHLRDWWTDAAQRPFQTAILLIGIALLSWLYLPICFQLFFLTRGFKAFMGSYWANPLRLVFPWALLQVWNPNWFGDNIESTRFFGLGWSVFLPGVAGLVYVIRKRLWYCLPLVTLMVLCIAFHPTKFPLLKIFPWASMIRVTGRVGVFLAAGFGLLALSLPRPKRSFIVLWALLAAAEFTFSMRLPTQGQIIPLSSEMKTHLDTIASTPGEALFDWPFCVRGGYGLRELCPDGGDLGADFALTRLHHKKVIGLSSGRLTKEMLPSLYADEWDALMAVRDRCFNEKEWAKFEKFFERYDFAGLHLHVRFVPPKCLDEYTKRFGQPISRADLPGSGETWFIPKAKRL